jgi:hypothetical protein
MHFRSTSTAFFLIIMGAGFNKPAVVYCNDDKEINHIKGEGWVLLFVWNY